MTMPAATVALPALGSADNAALDGRVTAVLSGSGGLLMAALAPLVPQSGEMVLAGALALLAALWAALTPVAAPASLRSGYTATASAAIVVGTAAAEDGTSLRLGAIALLCPVLTIACLRAPREVAAQGVFAMGLYAVHLVRALPAGPAAVGLLASGTVLAMLAGLICQLRGRLDATVAGLQAQAATDGLTGLRNRVGLRDALARTDSPAGALLLIDLDHFKRINDEHGHQAGDDVLVWFGELLRSCARPGDLVARYGGEEFVVYLPGAQPPSTVRERAEQLRERVQSAALRRGLPLTVSIGVAVGSRDDLPGLLRAADRALYDAKDAGRNLVRVS